MLYCKKKTIENNVGITSFAGRGTVEYTPEINVWQNHLIYEVSTIKKVLIIIGGHVFLLFFQKTGLCMFCQISMYLILYMDNID